MIPVSGEKANGKQRKYADRTEPVVLVRHLDDLPEEEIGSVDGGMVPAFWKRLLPPVILTTLQALVNWGRQNSTWYLPFGTACCGIELMAVGATRFDLDRHGMVPWFSPRQCDVMIVAGTITEKMAPAVVRLYEQMAEPRYVIAMGGCAISGGPFYKGYNVVPGVDRLIPVDVYVPGCPPRPEAVLHGIYLLRDRIARTGRKGSP